MQKLTAFKSAIRRELSLQQAKIWRLRSRIKYRSKDYRQASSRFLLENQRDMFFVLGTGRSGTQLISDLLDAAGNTLVCHEPNFTEDVGLMPDLRTNEALVRDYWEDFRSLEVYSRWMSSGKKKYGEVNGTLRYHAAYLSERYPEAPIFLLSRDPRGTIRSVMPWPFYLPDSKGAYNLQPLERDPWKEKWDTLSRFEKMCWVVADTYRYLLSVIPESRRLRLEDIVSDYSVVSSKFFDVLGVDISEETWHEIVGKPSRNKSKSYDYPQHKDWNSDQKKIYQVMCGEIAEELGYDWRW